MRLFVALPIPDPVAQRLLLMQGGVPGARWQAREPDGPVDALPLPAAKSATIAAALARARSARPHD